MRSAEHGQELKENLYWLGKPREALIIRFNILIVHLHCASDNALLAHSVTRASKAFHLSDELRDSTCQRYFSIHDRLNRVFSDSPSPLLAQKPMVMRDKLERH